MGVAGTVLGLSIADFKTSEGKTMQSRTVFNTDY